MKINAFGIHYLIDLKSKNNMHLYYASKNRYGYQIQERERFIDSLVEQSQDFVSKFDYIIIPESSQTFVLDFSKKFNKPISVIKKTNISAIIKNIDNLHLQKKEKISHLERIQDMGDTLKINKFKANQRKKYIDLIFEHDYEKKEGKGLIIDDSFFSGTTINSLKNITHIDDVLVIFSK